MPENQVMPPSGEQFKITPGMDEDQLRMQLVSAASAQGLDLGDMSLDEIIDSYSSPKAQTPVYASLQQRGDFHETLPEHWDKIPSAEKLEVDPLRTLHDPNADSGFRMKAAQNEMRRQRLTGEYSGYDYARYWTDRLPFAGPAINLGEWLEGSDIASSVKRIDDGKASANDYLNIAGAVEAMKYQGDKSMLRRAWDMMSHIPGLGIEFWATGGTATAGRVAVTRGAAALATTVPKGLASTVLRGGKLAAPAVGAATQAFGGMPHRAAESMLRHVAPDWHLDPEESGALKLIITDHKDGLEDRIKAVGKGGMDHFIEIFSERALGGTAKALGLGKVKGAKDSVMQSVRGTLAKRWLSKNPARRPSDLSRLIQSAVKKGGRAVKKGGRVAKKMGFDGVLEEMGEEAFDAIASGATGVEKDYGFPGKLWEDPFSPEAWEEMGVMFMAFSGIPLGSAVVGGMIGGPTEAPPDGPPPSPLSPEDQAVGDFLERQSRTRGKKLQEMGLVPEQFPDGTPIDMTKKEDRQRVADMIAGEAAEVITEPPGETDESQAPIEPPPEQRLHEETDESQAPPEPTIPPEPVAAPAEPQFTPVSEMTRDQMQAEHDALNDRATGAFSEDYEVGMMFLATNEGKRLQELKNHLKPADALKVTSPPPADETLEAPSTDETPAEEYQRLQSGLSQAFANDKSDEWIADNGDRLEELQKMNEEGKFKETTTPPPVEDTTPPPDPAARHISRVEAALPPEMAGVYDKDAGVKEKMTVREHTEQVQRNWDVENKALPPELAKQAGFESPEKLDDFMGTVIALHDIGKPSALAAGKLSDQHKHTIPILQQTMRGMGFSDGEVELATELVDNDHIGEFIQGVTTAATINRAKYSIEKSAADVGITPQAFMHLQSAFYKSDAGAYPTVRAKLAGDASKADKPLRIKNVRFLMLQEAIHGNPLDYQWLGTSGEAGGRSRGTKDTGPLGGFDFVHGSSVRFPRFSAELDQGANNHGPGAYLVSVEDEDVAEHYTNRAMRRLLRIFAKTKIRNFIMDASKEQVDKLIVQAQKERQIYVDKGNEAMVRKYDEALETLDHVRSGLYGRHILAVSFSPKKILVLGSMETGGMVSPAKRKMLLALAPEVDRDKAPNRINSLYQHIGSKIGRDELNNRLMEVGYDAISFVHYKGGFSREYEVMVALKHSDPVVKEETPKKSFKKRSIKPAVREPGKVTVKKGIKRPPPEPVTPPVKKKSVKKKAPKKPAVGPATEKGGPLKSETLDPATIKIDPDRFQFKGNVTDVGVVEGEQLKGDYRHDAAGVILVWEDKAGDFYVVNGHHRLDLAKRTNQSAVAVQVVSESQGYTEQAARALGAELNILDEKGSVDDYATFFRETEISEEEAEKRGLLARSKGKEGFMVGRFAEDDLWAAFKAGKVAPGKAAVIADLARGDAGMQAVGLSHAKSRMSEDEIRHALHVLKTFGKPKQETQGDLFGFDDAAVRESEAMGKAAAKIIKDKKEYLNAVRGAAKRPEKAKEMGLEGDFKAIKAKVEQIKSDLFQWEKWYTNPKLVAQVRQAVAGETPLFQDPTDGKAKPLTPENIQKAFKIDSDKAQAVHAVMAASGADLSKVSVTRGGKPGEGSLRQLTMAFKKWFGKSKVVDKDGNPLVVYHGTNENFTSFDPQMRGSIGGMADQGFFFTTDPHEASRYAGTRGGNVMPVYVSLQKPMELQYKDHGITDVVDDDRQLWSQLNKAEKGDFDGVILRSINNNPGHDLIVAFNPTQIKSTANRGTYDPGDPNILYQKGTIPLGIAKHLTPEELDNMSSQLADRIAEAIDEINISEAELEAAARAGEAKRGWYQRSTEYIFAAFGEDAPRFIGVLAATSPRAQVKINLTTALKVWNTWQDAGRPSTPAKLRKLLLKHGQLFSDTDIGAGAFMNNSIAALTSKTPESIKFSDESLKVQSFYDNLMGNMDAVTLDGWMGELGGINPARLGKKGMYKAYSALIRRVAKKMGWQPAEVQETTWAFGKAIAALQSKDVDSAEALKRATHEAIGAVPGYADMLVGDPDVRAQLKRLGLTDAIDQYDKVFRRAQKGKIKRTGSVLDQADHPRILARVASRIKQPEKSVGSRGIKGIRDTLYQAMPRWYSKARRVISTSSFPRSTTTEQALNMLKKQGVKDEEIQWMGLRELLGDKAKVTKQEMLDAIDTGLKLEETIKGDKKIKENLAFASRTGAWEVDSLSDAEPGEYQSVIDGGRYGDFITINDDGSAEWSNAGENKDFRDAGALEDWLREQRRETMAVTGEDYDTKFRHPDLALPGGKNYKELLIRLPTPSIKTMSRSDYNAAIEEQDRGGGTFTGAHFDEPNILVHIRFNERTDADGEKVLFIEEIQSDWHQEGRKKGYANYTIIDPQDSNPDGSSVEWGRGTTEAEARADAEDWTDRNINDEAERDEVRARLEVNTEVVPAAPFISKTQFAIVDESGNVKKKPDGQKLLASSEAEAQKLQKKYGGTVKDMGIVPSDDYTMLGMKRAIQYAAENGFDRVAWTTGEQQVKRYDLSTHVDEIAWLKTDINGAEDAVMLTLTKDGKELTKTLVPQKELDRHIGKELADKIIKEDKAEGAYSGLDLKVGGEGMKGFYDKMLPNEVNKFVKKFGAKVGVTNVRTDIEESAEAKYKVVDGDGTLLTFYNQENAKELAERWVEYNKENKPDAKAVPVEEGFGTTEQHSFDITPKMRESALKHGQPMFQKKKGETAKGAVDFLEDGSALLRAFDTSDISTALHEFAHVARRQLVRIGSKILTKGEVELLEKESGVVDGVWTVEAEEKFARLVERYFWDGKTASEKLTAVFEKIRKWMREVYGTNIKGTPLEEQVSDEVREVFDILFTGERKSFHLANATFRAKSSFANNVGRQGVPDDLVGEGGPSPLTKGDRELLEKESGIAKKRAGLWLKKYLTSAGNLPSEIFDDAKKADASIAAQERQINFNLTELKDAMAKEIGTTNLDAKSLRLIDLALKGNIKLLNKWPKIKSAVSKMRRHIDILSQRLIDNGLAVGALEISITEHKGVYVTRSFEMFDTPTGRWSEKIPIDVRNAAVSWVLSLPQNANLTAKQANALLETWLIRDGAPLDMVRKHMLGSKDLSITKARHNLPPEILAFFGEYTDPMVNYAKSVTKMVNLAANHEMLVKVVADGAGIHFFKEGDLDVPDGYNFPIVPPVHKPYKPGKKTPKELLKTQQKHMSSAMSPLAGYTTTQEIAEEFQQAFLSDTVPWWLEHYMKLVSISKVSKTILSPMTQTRNFLGNALFAVGNGHWRLEYFKDAFLVGKEDVRGEVKDLLPAFLRESWGGKPNKAWQDKLKEYVDLGVLDDSAHAGELQEALRIAWNKDMRHAVDTMGPAGKVGKYSRSLAKAASSVYQASDNFWKVFAFENEKRRYTNAYKKAGVTKTPAEINKIAAKIVRNTYPTYSLAVRAVKKWRRMPLFGTFVTFPAEVFRTQYHTQLQTWDELHSPINEIKAIGAQRAIGTALAYGLPVITAAVLRYIFGIDGDDEEDLRQHMPPWSENSQIFWTHAKYPGGKAEYIDMSYMLPLSYLENARRAAWRGSREGIYEAMEAASGELFRPFVEEEMLTLKFGEAWFNKKKSGGDVYNETASAEDKYEAVRDHILSGVEPGFWTQGKRVLKGVQGRVEPWGKEYNTFQEVAAIISGMRFQTVDAETSLSFDARDFRRLHPATTKQFSVVVASKGTVTSQEVEEAYFKMDRARRRLFDRIQRKAQAALRLGVPLNKAFLALKANGISEKDSMAILDGTYVPYIMSLALAKRVASTPTADMRVDAYRQAVTKALETGFEPD